VSTQASSNPRYCSHILDYEKKGNRITWLRCIKCKQIVGWLEDNRKKVEGKVVKLSYTEKKALR
jgi:hypothetical protein